MQYRQKVSTEPDMQNNQFSHITPARYPLGVQSFEDIRLNNKVYVDKTALIHKLVTDGQYYFLSRPRRFGKSLLLSTLQAYFEGRRELFQGLAIEHLEHNWFSRPVIHLSFAKGVFTDIDRATAHIKRAINSAAKRLAVTVEDGYPESMFADLIENTRTKYQTKVVVLIDEYDKPLLDTQYRDPKVHQAIKDTLRGIYSCVKDCGEDIHFGLITGITKFSQINIFSGLNNIRDISLSPVFDSICGISETEMEAYFHDDMMLFAKNGGQTFDKARQEFRLSYDGYHFAGNGQNIYNPYSVLSALCEGRFDTYWYQSGNPNYLIEALSKKPLYNFKALEGHKAIASELMDPNISYREPIALLYQTGYLTIKDFDRESNVYTLGFPNREVSAAFCQNLMAAVAYTEHSEVQFSAPRLMVSATTGNADELMTVLDAGLATFKYDQLKEPSHELHFHLILHIICMCVGLNVESEVQTTDGRIDMVLKTQRFIFIIEFKLDESAATALAQIKRKDYPAKYRHDGRKLILIGANFSTETRRLDDWLIEEC